MTLQYALLSYHGTNNLGDEIQSLAARQFLPRVDYYVDRETMDSFVPIDKSNPVILILNGWLCYQPQNWPPSPYLQPLLISLHITAEKSYGCLSPAERLLAEPAINYLKRLGPVGARDQHTLTLLRNAGVDCYYSGCLTLTLQRPSVSCEQDLIVLNDVPARARRYVVRKSSKRIIETSHGGYTKPNPEERFIEAEALLELYAKASCVVTTNLHAALPCLAFGTPVLLLDIASDQYRFSGLHDLVHHASVKAYMQSKFNYDVNNPPPNKPDYLFLRESLAGTVQNFIANAETYPERLRDPLSIEERLEVLIGIKNAQAKLCSEYAEVLSSSSWRLTKPLRYLARLLHIKSASVRHLIDFVSKVLGSVRKPKGLLERWLL